MGFFDVMFVVQVSTLLNLYSPVKGLSLFKRWSFVRGYRLIMGQKGQTVADEVSSGRRG